MVTSKGLRAPVSGLGFLISRPLVQHLNQPAHIRTFRGSNVIATRRHAEQNTMSVAEIEQRSQAEPGVEMIARARCEQRLRDAGALDEINVSFADGERVRDRVDG